MKKSKIPPRESYLEDIRNSCLSEKYKEALFAVEEYSLKHPLSLQEMRKEQVQRNIELVMRLRSIISYSPPEDGDNLN